MFVNNESTAGVGNLITMKSHATLEIMQLICMPGHGEREFEFI